MFRSTVHAINTAVVLFSTWLSACGDDRGCPDGFYKNGINCRRIDAGLNSNADSAVVIGPDAENDASAEDDSSSPITAPTAIEAGVGRMDASLVPATSDAAPADATSDASSPDAEAVVDASIDAGPMPECDGLHPCLAGNVCSANKCVSACTQTQCDPNASCSLMGSTPVCSCNGGFASIKDASGKVSCIRDLKCEELGCDAQNGECLGDTAQTRRCACKNGFTGDGKTCSPVSCPIPDLANGKVSTPDGLTFGKMATFTCNGGYDFANKASSVTRMCGADKSWGAAVPKCEPRDCGPLAIPYATVDTSRGTQYGSTPATVVCQHSFVRVGPATVECQADGKWSTRPSCLGCGDKQISNIPGIIKEECDPTAPNWNDWSCGGCVKRNVYLTCGPDTCEGSTPDANGVWCYLGVCTTTCDSEFDCISEPSSSGANAFCSKPSGGICFIFNCATRADCPPGQGCQKSPGSTPFCMPCGGENCF